MCAGANGGFKMYKIIAILLVLTLPACATTNHLSRSSGKYADALALSSQAQEILGLEHPVLPTASPNDALIIYLAKMRPASERDVAVAKATAMALLMNSDALCERYMADFMLKSRTTTSVLKVTSLGLSTAAGITEPVSSANTLAALSAFASGSEEKLTSTVMANNSPELLYRAVMAERTRERTRLLTLLADDSLGMTAPTVVLAQVADYHARCGPTIGINSLSASVQQATNAAPEKGAQDAATFVKGLQ